MNKLIVRPTLQLICKEANENNLVIKDIHHSAGKFFALMQEGDDKKGETFLELCQGHDTEKLMTYILERDGVVEKMMPGSMGAVFLVSRFHKSIFEQREKEIAEKIERERIAKEKAQRKAMLEELEAKKKELEDQMKVLKKPVANVAGGSESEENK